MEIPLTPLEFARRARRLYPEREAVVDGERRFSYAQFLGRCERWSAALQQLGVRPGDRVLVIAPNTHAMLEQFYAVPQIGAILVPVNYRLSAADFRYMIGHCEPVVVCAHPDYIAPLEGMRGELSGVRHFVALEGSHAGWLAYEALLGAADAAFTPVPVNESDVITINYTSGTTSRPKGVMITHRNAWMNSVGTLVHHPLAAGGALPVDAADVPRQRLDLRVDRDGGGRHARVPAQGRAAAIYDAHQCRASDDAVRCAHGADRGRQRARGAAARACAAACACSPPAPRRRPLRLSASRASSAGRSRMSTA